MIPTTPRDKKYGRAHCNEILALIDSVVVPKSDLARDLAEQRASIDLGEWETPKWERES